MLEIPSDAMPHQPLCLVAKHVPEKFRDEPRNVGVILWTPHGVYARFLGESKLKPGVSLRSLPDFIADKYGYEQWVSYWRRCIDEPSVMVSAFAPSPRKNSPDFLDFLRRATPDGGSFRLTNGLALFEDVAPANTETTLDALFSQLVHTPDIKRDDDLESLVKATLKERGLRAHDYFKINHEPASAGLHFDYAKLRRDLSVEAVWMRVPTHGFGSGVEASVAMRAFKLMEGQKRQWFTRECSSAIISCDAAREREIRKHLDILGEYAGTIYNMKSADDRRALFADIPLPLEVA